MKEVFISYSTIDTAPAETVRNVLEKNGISCWMAPRDIPGGSNYTKEIPAAIRGCKVFVLMLSANAQRSHWVLKELDSAVNCGKVILPFMLEDCVLNDEFNFLLTGAQRYAAYQKTAEAMETLIGRIRGILDADRKEPESAAPVVPEEPAARPAPVVLPGQVVCPACGASEVKHLPRRIKRHGAKELLTLLFIPLLAEVIGLLGLLVSAVALPDAAVAIWLVAAVIGAVGGNHLSKNLVRRWRLRSHNSADCYRCQACRKVFLHSKDQTA